MSERPYRHFTLEQLADGVYAAIAAEEGGAGCNAGIIDLGGQTLVFDTFATLAAARELRQAAEALTGSPIRYVVNSHDHPDHFNGNKIFSDDAVLIASTATCTAIEATGATRMANMGKQIRGGMESVQEQLRAAESDEQRAELQRTVALYEVLLGSYPTAEDLRVPHLTFDRRMLFHGQKRQAELVTFGGGHSGCDAVLVLPDDGLLFSGDLITGGPLILQYGDPDQWRVILGRLAELPVRTVAPGHGPVQEAAPAIERSRRYLEEITRVAAEAARSGTDVEAIPVPEGEAAHWFRSNLRFLMSRR